MVRLRRGRKAPARRGGKKAVGRKGRGRAKGRDLKLGQFAVCKETMTFADQQVDTVDGKANANIFSLDMFPRSLRMSRLFRFYRAKHVEWTYEPYYNTFQEASTGVSSSIPYFYWNMNRTQDSSATNLTAMQAMGAKPIKFSKVLRIKYVPNWCQPGLSAVTGISNTMVHLGLTPSFKLLACPPSGITSSVDYLYPMKSSGLPSTYTMSTVLPSAVTYNGHDSWVDQQVTGPALIYRTTCTVIWEFIGPLATNSSLGLTGDNEPLVPPAPIDPSPGISTIQSSYGLT